MTAELAADEPLSFSLSRVPEKMAAINSMQAPTSDAAFHGLDRVIVSGLEFLFVLARLVFELQPAPASGTSGAAAVVERTVEVRSWSSAAVRLGSGLVASRTPAVAVLRWGDDMTDKLISLGKRRGKALCPSTSRILLGIVMRDGGDGGGQTTRPAAAGWDRGMGPPTAGVHGE
ncbi:hypothetical protein THAOC_07485, partial [Thalassiosira oceanica]